MNLKTLLILSASAFVLSACSKAPSEDAAASSESASQAPSAQSAAKPAPVAPKETQASAPASSQNQNAASNLKLVRVATLESPVAFEEFQRNVSLVQAQKQNIVALNQRIESLTDESAKAELKIKLDEALAKLNENNAKMAKAYGFTLTRNYVVAVEKSSIYLQLSDAEAQKIKLAQSQAK